MDDVSAGIALLLVALVVGVAGFVVYGRSRPNGVVPRPPAEPGRDAGPAAGNPDETATDDSAPGEDDPAPAEDDPAPAEDDPAPGAEGDPPSTPDPPT